MLEILFDAPERVPNLVRLNVIFEYVNNIVLFHVPFPITKTRDISARVSVEIDLMGLRIVTGPRVEQGMPFRSYCPAEVRAGDLSFIRRMISNFLTISQ